MRTKYAGDNLTFYTKLTIITANVVALTFLITAFFLAASFPGDGFEQAASALQFAPTSWSIIWTAISSGLNSGGVVYHPGIDIAFEIISIGLAFGMVWILIWWVDTIKRRKMSPIPVAD
ncbi:hypothetical protein LTR05_005701 [Lithohypha guttulata]|uniref:Uncharacterized protein n=1 Tax=Lithohypha guttulata TaxID=1690604 RepID=A0AAN7SZP7_9EURO|nr:hypothetical protein LTR05_005701 [Lithohypha guttulata]